jgi:surface antigen
MKAFPASLLLLLAALIAAPAARAAVPEAYLSSQDRWYQEQAVQNALEFNKIGQATAWTNPTTGHRGKVVPTLTYRNSEGFDCRSFAREFTVGGRAAGGTGTRCRMPDGIWLRPFAPRPVYTGRYYDAYGPYPYHYRPYPYYYRPYPYYTPFTFSFYYGWHGHSRHHRRWRRRH